MKENTLHTIKNSGFKTPKDYFDGLEDNIISQTKISSTVESSGFKVPDNYFSTLEHSILDQVYTEKKTPKVIKLFSKKNLIYISSIAASVVLIFNLSDFKSTPTFDNLDKATVENYILNENIESNEIASLLTNDDLVEENFIEYSLSNENIENYIIDNIDIEDIILE